MINTCLLKKKVKQGTTEHNKLKTEQINTKQHAISD